MALLIILILLLVFFRLVFAIVSFLLFDVWVVLCCIVATIRNEVEDRRLRKEWREAQKASRNQ